MKFSRIQFESSNYCNMRCAFCPNRLMTRERKNLDLELFKKIIDDIVAHDLTETISFAGNGEPLLDPNLGEKLDYCRRRGLSTIITTNGLLLDKLNDALIKNLDCLYISWQTFNEKTFPLRDVPISYDLYRQKLLDFIKEHQGKLKIVISLMQNETRRWFTRDLMGKKFQELLKQNLRDFLATAGEISSAAQAELKKALAEKRRLSFQQIELAENIFLNVDQFFDWGGNLSCYSDKFRRIPASAGRCKIMADGPLVLSDGRLSLCCVDYDGQVTVGDLNQSSFSELINSEKYQTILKNFADRKIVLPYCQKCLGRWQNQSRLKNILYKIENKIYHLSHYRR
ncbi:MAG TPA: radical SAM protein [Candidatus Methylomirabilis sp.]|nr:radical SAM protein [Candidatus Methylomirabilis sp.]